MATVLKLSNGIETIDFISGSSDYRLLADDALQISMPESKRVFGGDPLLRKGEGSRLIERQYENREISIDFKITATDHNSWVEDIRRIDRVLNDAKEYSKKGYGNKVTVTDNIEEAYKGADFVYAKSWGNLAYYGKWDEEKKIREGLKHFIVDSKKMGLTNNAFFSHCLPIRRNVKATDEVIDSKYSLIYEEAENRLHTTKALLASILGD